MSKYLINQIAEVHATYAEKLIQLAQLAHIESQKHTSSALCDSWTTVAAELKAASIRAANDEVLILRKHTTHTIL